MMFKIRKKKTTARSGLVSSVHGRLKTPFFMPDATRGFVKLLTRKEMEAVGLGPLVINTYHLFLQPGEKLIRRAGGAHRFINWDKPLLSDSGGFQVFSLIRQARGKAPLGKVTDKGVIFRSPIDGRLNELTPEKAIRIQFDLGVDMMVCLDDCPPNDAPREEIGRAVERTLAWAARCKKEYERQLKARRIPAGQRPLLFSVIQGGTFLDLRERCASGLVGIGFDGYGFGAKPVDSQGNFLEEVLRETAAMIPEKALRFALGIGLPEDILRCASYGWDMFDCVIPTREGRHGRLFLPAQDWKKKAGAYRGGKQNFYKTANINNARFAKDFSPINPDSRLPELREYSKAYLNHLFKTKEALGAKLASLNNLEFYMELMETIRKNIDSPG